MSIRLDTEGLWHFHIDASVLIYYRKFLKWFGKANTKPIPIASLSVAFLGVTEHNSDTVVNGAEGVFVGRHQELKGPLKGLTVKLWCNVWDVLWVFKWTYLCLLLRVGTVSSWLQIQTHLVSRIMHQNIALILRQFNQGKNTFMILVLGPLIKMRLTIWSALSVGYQVHENKSFCFSWMCISSSVTRFGNFLDFKQLFKAFGKN